MGMQCGLSTVKTTKLEDVRSHLSSRTSTVQSLPTPCTCQCNVLHVIVINIITSPLLVLSLTCSSVTTRAMVELVADELQRKDAAVNNPKPSLSCARKRTFAGEHAPATAFLCKINQWYEASIR